MLPANSATTNLCHISMSSNEGARSFSVVRVFDPNRNITFSSWFHGLWMQDLQVHSNNGLNLSTKISDKIMSKSCFPLLVSLTLQQVQIPNRQFFTELGLVYWFIHYSNVTAKSNLRKNKKVTLNSNISQPVHQSMQAQMLPQKSS